MSSRLRVAYRFSLRYARKPLNEREASDNLSEMEAVGSLALLVIACSYSKYVVDTALESACWVFAGPSTLKRPNAGFCCAHRQK